MILELYMEGTKKAQDFDLQKRDLVLLSTSASNGERQCIVFSGLIASADPSP